MSRGRTPQEKKVLSYAKDRRNDYHENAKASRKLIPRRKAAVNRVFRRRINKILASNEVSDIIAAERVESDVRSVRRINWKKAPDAPLGAFLEKKLRRRSEHAGAGKTLRKRATEFLASMEISTECDDNNEWLARSDRMEGLLIKGDSEEGAVYGFRDVSRVLFMEMSGGIDELRISTDGTISYSTR